MSRFLRALEKVGLVALDDASGSAPQAELSDAEVQEILQSARKDEVRSAPTPQAPARAPAGPPVAGAQNAPTDAAGLDERSFEDIFRAASVPPSPFSAEKLLKLLDGLRVMDAGTRRTAILAMDAADDGWTLEDPVLDADRKMRALQSEQTRLAELVVVAEQKAKEQLAEHDRYQSEATATIRQQIADLEQLLERELAQVAELRATAKHDLDRLRESVERGKQRLQREVERLAEIPRDFGTVVGGKE